MMSIFSDMIFERVEKMSTDERHAEVEKAETAVTTATEYRDELENAVHFLTLKENPERTRNLINTAHREGKEINEALGFPWRQRSTPFGQRNPALSLIQYFKHNENWLKISDNEGHTKYVVKGNQ